MTTTEAARPDTGAEWYSSLDHPTPDIGVILQGVDAAALGKAEVANDLKRLLHKHRVVFVRGLKPLEVDPFQDFAGRLGTLGRHVKYTDAAETSVLITQDGAPLNHWHTDGTYQELPPRYVVLQAHRVPNAGGDTLWANTVSAYQGLPGNLKALADSLRVRHSNAWWRWANTQTVDFPTVETVHPLVQFVPDTGESALLLGEHAMYVEGMTRADSAALIELFQRHITAPEHVVRWRWQPGDIAIWDGQMTQHYATADYQGSKRVMRRAWITSEVRPVGPPAPASPSLSS
jgi:taurine dioxygenase